MTFNQRIGKWLAAVATALWLGLCMGVTAQTQPTANGLIPPDPGAQGYKVDNNELRFKEHLRLPKNISLIRGGWVDERYWLANLIADEAGSYEQDRIRKVVLVDDLTGEVKPTPYEGNIQCFADGNLAVSITSGRKDEWIFSYGRYGEALQTLKGGIPEGMELNKLSCKLLPSQNVPKTLSDGRTLDWRVRLRADHGHLVVLRGRPLPAQAPDFSPELQRLMQQPFMRTMAVVSSLEQWFLKTPQGGEIAIPNNPGEAAGEYAPVSYVPYLDAYFIAPYAGGRPFDPEELRQIPRFARLLYPDGTVDRFGIPDVIWEPYKRKELSYNTYYSRRGLIWEIRPLANFKAYTGELELGAYLDLRKDKVLKRLPDIKFVGRNPDGGCTVGTRTETTQRRPHYLFNTYYINLCTGE